MNGHNRRMRARTRLEQAGFSLAEAVVTVAVSMIGLGGVMMMNAQQLKLVSSTRESNAASWVLQDRLERLRNVSWEHLTKPNNLKLALADLPDCAQLLPGCTERITIVKSNEAEVVGADKLVIERGADGTMQTISTANFTNGREVKVDVLVSWTSRGGRTRERSYTSVISESGVNRTNVPGFGGPTGTTPVPNGSPSDGWADGSTTPSTEQPTEIPNTNGSNNDNNGGTSTGSSGSTNNGNGNNGNGNGNSGNGGSTNTNNGNGNPHGNTNGQPGKK